MTVPDIRIQVLNASPVSGEGEFILYWMIAYRRGHWNFALQRAAQWARELNKPLVILEALRSGYPWASDRLHRFILDGMADNTRRLESKPVSYYRYVEPVLDAAKGLLVALAARACLVVTDDFPAFMLPRMVRAATRRLPVRLEQSDSNGLLPLRSADRVFTTAYSFRRFLQQTLRWHLLEFPEEDPLAGVNLRFLHSLPREITERWPKATDDMLSGGTRSLAGLPIDHSVPATETRGGSAAAEAVLQRFLDERLTRYAEARNQPGEEASSELSPYLHFGHVSAHQIFVDLMTREGWSIGDLATVAKGSRSGWWGVSPSAEAFLDQLVTWRELGFNMCWQRDDYDRFESLPQWAIKTLSEHARDPRPYLYALGDLETGRTHDPLWNAAQMQLLREGRIHNYLRMLWGKKILEWTTSPQEALAVMIELNNKYALDGRDPNSYSGIFWCLGRYDRPWGPERPVYGTTRYMTSESIPKRIHAREYVRRYSP